MEDNVLGFPGYHITPQGELYKHGKPVKVYFHKRYLRTRIHYKGVSKNVKIHRLVAEAYLPNPQNLPLVMHLDDDPLNNRVDNLKWGTYKENRLSAIKTDHMPKLTGSNNPCYGLVGSKNPNAKLSQEDIKLIIALHHEGLSAAKIHQLMFSDKVKLSTVRTTINKHNKQKGGYRG